MGTMTAVSQPRRVDLELVARGFAPSRERAQALVAAGLVELDGCPLPQAIVQIMVMMIGILFMDFQA